MSTLYTQIHQHLLNLIQAYVLTEQKSTILGLFDLLAKESLAINAVDLTSNWSTINNNGVPFQLVVSSGQKEAGLRFLTEVAAGTLPYEQINLSYQRLQEICRALTLDSFPLIQSMGDMLLPQDSQTLASLQAGTIWIGLGFAQQAKPRISVYYEGRWNSLEARWLRLFQLLVKQKCYRAAEQLRSLLHLANSFSQPLGVAIDIDQRGLKVIKLYFRTFRSATTELAQLLTDAGFPQHQGVPADLAQTLFQATEFPPQAIVYYLAIAPAADQIAAIKIDVCSHCVALPDAELSQRWITLANRLDIDVSDYAIALDELSVISEANQSCHAFLGVGVDTSNHIKLNAYLRPIIREVSSQQHNAIQNIASNRVYSFSNYR
jgi:hypothetical protein